MEPMIHVGIGQMRVARSPARLMCVGLGSCIAVVLFDPSTKIGGVAHVMLPDDTVGKQDSSSPAKFGNTAAKALLEEMKKVGVNPYIIVARITGGANMFKNVSPDMKDIGKENAEQVKKSLQALHIKIIAEDVGGTTGRTIELDTATGRLIIKNIHGKTIVL